MQYVIKIAIVAIALSITAPVAAQNFETGVEALQRGDYVAALREIRPLADQGHVNAQASLG
jgi:hypothetical protein